MVVRRFGLVCVAFVLSALPISAFAYTPEQEQACTSDAFRVCGSDIPDVDRVTACMMRNKSQLSPACRAQFGAEPVSDVVSERGGRPLSIKPGSARKSSSKAHKPRKHAAE